MAKIGFFYLYFPSAMQSPGKNAAKVVCTVLMFTSCRVVTVRMKCQSLFLLGSWLALMVSLSYVREDTVFAITVMLMVRVKVMLRVREAPKTSRESQNAARQTSHRLSVCQVVFTKRFGYTERLWIFCFSENRVIEEIFKLFFCQYF